MRIRFHPDAEAEFYGAAEWYGRQRKGLDDEFLFCIDEAFQRIVHSPTMYPRIHNQVRKAVVRRFPYVIFFEADDKEIKIYAIFHSKRNPKQWKSRLM